LSPPGSWDGYGSTRTNLRRYTRTMRSERDKPDGRSADGRRPPARQM
jgi:hypothetical protein